MTKKYISYTREMIAENKKPRILYPQKQVLKPMVPDLASSTKGKKYISYTREMIAKNNQMRTLKPASRELISLFIEKTEMQQPDQNNLFDLRQPDEESIISHWPFQLQYGVGFDPAALTYGRNIWLDDENII